MNDQMRVSIDHLLEGVQIIDRQWRYVYVNHAAATHGQGLMEIGRSVMESYPGIEQTEVFGALQRVMNTRRPETLQTQFTFPTGDTRWFDLVIDPVPDGICVLSLDITERQQAEEERQRLAQEIDRQRLHIFRATMTTVHDIVNNFLNNLQLIRMEAEDRLPPEILSLFDELTTEAAAKVRKLGELQIITETKMGIGVGIAYEGSAPPEPTKGNQPE